MTVPYSNDLYTDSIRIVDGVPCIYLFMHATDAPQGTSGQRAAAE